MAKHKLQQIGREGGGEDETARGGWKSCCSLKSIRVMLRAEAEEGGGVTGLEGGILANVERGPIKVKAKGKYE